MESPHLFRNCSTLFTFPTPHSGKSSNGFERASSSLPPHNYTVLVVCLPVVFTCQVQRCTVLPVQSVRHGSIQRLSERPKIETQFDVIRLLPQHSPCNLQPPSNTKTHTSDDNNLFLTIIITIIIIISFDDLHNKRNKVTNHDGGSTRCSHLFTK